MEHPVHAPVFIVGADFAEHPYIEGRVMAADESGYLVAPVAGGAAVRKRHVQLFAANGADSDPDDHCALTHLNEATLLESTLRRAQFGAIYTWVGASQLLSVNPCQGLEGAEDAEDEMMFYRNRTREVGEAEPHAYAVAEAACARLHRQRRVAVLVSGESGAGKTEASRLVMQYLVWRSGASASAAACTSGAEANARAERIRSGVLSSNTVLESLGNARMHANANSSRFGKHTLLQIEPAPSIGSPITLRGAQIECFLLERCRHARASLLTVTVLLTRKG